MMSFRPSIRSLLLLTLCGAIFAAFVALSNVRTDNLQMTVALSLILIAFIAIPATCASIAFDVYRTRRSAELGAFYGFVGFSVAGILLGSVPAVN